MSELRLLDLSRNPLIPFSVPPVCVTYCVTDGWTAGRPRGPPVTAGQSLPVPRGPR